MRESRWPPPFTRALKRNLQGSFLLGDGCWMLGIDEVLEGQKLQYYIGLIGLIRLIGLIGLIGLMADKANSAQRLIVFYWANRFYLAN